MLKDKIALLAGEVIDTAVMNVAALRRFYAANRSTRPSGTGVLLSLHLKATMMKVSDPVMFGHCVSVFYADALEKQRGDPQEIGANVNNGLADVLEKLDGCRPPRRPRSRPTSPRSTTTVPPWPWSTRARASPTCTCPTT